MSKEPAAQNSSGHPFVIGGLICYGAMWIATAFFVAAIAKALGRAEAAVTGDISGVVTELRYAREAAAIGMPLGVAAFVLFYLGVKREKARAAWIYCCGLSASWTALVIIPVGTILGVVGILHFRRHRSEYLAGRASGR